MKKLNIELALTNGTDIVRKEIPAKSEANMWNLLREIRNGLTEEEITNGATAKVFEEDGTLFKDIVFKRNSKGKIEMVNLVKETCRYAKVKAAKFAAAAKTEARKAKKREADRRYREKKRAAKAAAAQVEETK